MNLIYGDMWNDFEKSDLFCITTNGTILNGRLIMGAGIAKQANKLFPHLKWSLARTIEHKVRMQNSRGTYGLVVVSIDNNHRIGAFQTKYHWKDDSYISLIRHSCSELFRYIMVYNPEYVCLNFPGIGNGNLLYSDVLKVINYLPDNVYIYTDDIKIKNELNL